MSPAHLSDIASSHLDAHSIRDGINLEEFRLSSYQGSPEVLVQNLKIIRTSTYRTRLRFMKPLNGHIEQHVAKPVMLI